MGASYGAGNYAMCGRSYEPRFLFAWPHTKTAVMGSEQLVGVLTTVGREKAIKSGKSFDEQAALAAGEMFKKRVEDQSEAYYVSSLGLDDGIIDPRNTRDILGITLSVVHNTEIKSGGTYGISRL
eukprot:TRINITY_DN2160_c0_g2_i3.p1 TRINITY_DN2160_c0_g2~~TRINITY_DN2160_c0_g2_i3.p1  ORF type:complete len:125 (+),score=27.17 TRINITY_DN2160_c0_g2_i3:107-481(+)